MSADLFKPSRITLSELSLVSHVVHLSPCYTGGSRFLISRPLSITAGPFRLSWPVGHHCLPPLSLGVLDSHRPDGLTRWTSFPPPSKPVRRVCLLSFALQPRGTRCPTPSKPRLRCRCSRNYLNSISQPSPHVIIFPHTCSLSLP